MQTIGERLEDARKKKGISIREAAEATKIRGDYLQKFESNHFDIGLTEIYTRGFLRNYAQFLKIPADRILNDYAALGHGEIRPRQPSREIYGRMDISVASAGEPSDRAAPPEETAAEPAPARAPQPHQPRYPRGSGAPLPGGPDPAIVWQYLKWGALVVAVVVVALIGKSLLGPSRPRDAAPATGTTSQPSSAPAPAPVSGNYFSLVALDVVRVNVFRQNGDNDGDEIFSGTLAKGQSQVVPWTSAVYIRASDGDNVKIEIRGKRYDTQFHGYGRCALPEPAR